jgi:phosphonate transport system ATP-binding protein
VAAVLEIHNLSKDYRGTPALTDVSLTVKKGEFVAVIGRSGAGKSTLLRCINRLVEPSSGRVLVDGTDVTGLGRRGLRSLRTKVGMIFQHYNLVPRLTVVENVLHGRLGFKSTWAGMWGLYNEGEKRRALDLLAQLGLEDAAGQRCDRLSGGQKQRVGIARALIQDPRLILCDEPIASLDPGSAKVIMDQLRSICDNQGITIVVNLHQVDVAVKYADRVVGIRGGRVEFDGTPKKLHKKDVAAIYGSDSEDLLVSGVGAEAGE